MLNTTSTSSLGRFWFLSSGSISITSLEGAAVIGRLMNQCPVLCFAANPSGSSQGAAGNIERDCEADLSHLSLTPAFLVDAIY